ncbi:MAG: glycosyltransferase family 39 protein [Ardenticatenaceae bacterium]|nr:glycosyltransferase family 39 protein [Ardenticatenaceae bacterium]
MNENQEKRWLRLILGLFVLLGAMYALVTPVFEASDELWHYPMIRHLADGNPLPVQVFDPAQAGPWKQEASQPPLYYYLGAALTFWIDASDMETIRWENPHVNNGIITADGNINLTIKNPDWNPWQGTLLAVRIVRLFSVLLGAATVYLTYLIGKELAPNRPEIALGAAALNAFTPMFLFISGAVNNDNLAIPLASLAILLMIRAVGGRLSVSGNWITDNGLPITDYWKTWLLIGTVIGLAILTKEGTFGLLPLALGTIFIAYWKGKRNAELHGEPQSYAEKREVFWGDIFRNLGWTAVSFLILLLPVILIAGWWYWRNIVLYDDFLGWNAFIAVLGQRAHPASLAQLWSERWGFMLSYWGLFGGVNVPMPLWLYHILNGIVVVGVGGFVIYLAREIRDWRLEIRRNLQSPISNLQTVISNLLDFVTNKFALVVCLLFVAAVVVGLIQWATTTWSSQGRLVFTAMSAECAAGGGVDWLATA